MIRLVRQAMRHAPKGQLRFHRRRVTGAGYPQRPPWWRRRNVETAAYAVATLAVMLVGSAASVDARQWTHAARAGNTAYFLIADPPSIERYDLNAGQWLSVIALPERATALAADDAGLYLAFDKRVVRRELDGTQEMPLRNTTVSVTGLVTTGDLLFIVAFSNLWSVDKHSGEAIDNREYFYSLTGISAAPAMRKLFARSSNVSPSDVVSIEYDTAGRLGEQRDSPYHGDFPSGSQTWVFPGDARVVDDSGTIYNTNNLSFGASLAGAFDDLDFYVDVPIVLRGNTLFSYSSAFTETGRYTLSATAAKIYVSGETVYAFRPGGGDVIEVTPVAIDLISPPEPGEPVDPNGLAYEPDDIELGRDGTLYILQSGLLSIFRWSLAQRAYLSTIPLAEAPTSMAYASETNRLYLAYPGGKLTQIHLDESTAEQSFTNAPQETCAIAGAGSFLLVCHSGFSFSHHTVYGPDAAALSDSASRWATQEFTWSPANRKAYYFRDGISPNDLHCAEITDTGTLGSERETPLHEDRPFVHPIRVAPDGSIVVLGSGSIFHGESLDELDTLPNAITDAAWVYDTLFTLRDIEPDSQVQAWANGFDMRSSFFQLSGSPLRLFAREGQLLVITSIEGVPHFSVYEDLVETPTPTSTGQTATPTLTPTRTVTQTRTATSTPRPSFTATTTPRPCPGDCNGNRDVTVAELITAVNVALEQRLASVCLAADANSNARITVDELVAAVRSLLRGCPALPPTATYTITPTPTPTGTSTNTPTLGPTCPSGSPAPATVVAVDLPVRDLVYDRTSQLLYASVPSRGGERANSLTVVDPHAETIGPSFPMGNNPGRLAISDDGSFLYVALDEAASVQRFDVSAQVPDIEFILGSDDFFGPLYAEDIAVMPGRPASVAVSLRRAGVSPRHGGVAVYDDGVKRRLQSQDHTGSNVIEFADSPDTLYGYNNETTEFGLRRLAVTPDGVIEVAVAPNLIDGFGQDMKYEGGSLYATSGVVIDPGQLRSRGRFDGVTFGLPAPDSSVQRVFFATTGGSVVRIEVFDQRTRLLVDLFEVSGASGDPVAFVRFGENGLALATTSDHVYLIRSPLVCRTEN